MFKCFSCFGSRGTGESESSPSLKLVLIGLDNAGKSTLLNTLRSIDVDTAPTYGFISHTIRSAGGVDIEVYDLGGGQSIRKIWERYYAEVYGAIFVVDAADSTRIDEARTVLTEAVSDCRIRGKPLLVFANKQDKEGAMPASEVVEKLGLADAGDEDGGGRLAEQFSVMACTAKMFTEDVACGGQHAAHIDSAIHEGISWMQTAIESDLNNMHARVEREAAEQRAEEKRKVEERRRRVEAAREERRRQEAEAEVPPKSIEDGKAEPHDNDAFSVSNADAESRDSVAVLASEEDTSPATAVHASEPSENGTADASMNEATSEAGEPHEENTANNNSPPSSPPPDTIMDTVLALQQTPNSRNQQYETTSTTSDDVLREESVSLPGHLPSPTKYPSPRGEIQSERSANSDI